jgi:hypothetical protein
VALDRRRVTVFADERRASKLLTNIRTNGVIAVVFSQPSSHRTVQLKGSDAVVLEPVEDDPVIIAAYADSFVADLCSFGYSEAFARTLVTAASEKVVAITFTPEAAFDQTPGPHAGRSLGR